MSMSKERFKNTNWKMSYEEYMLCDCASCDKECIHKGAYRRLLECDGGLELCERLRNFTSCRK